jgi:ABC-type uncharacterized transport system permease subunit
MVVLLDLLVALLPLLYGVAAINYSVYFVRKDPFAERTCTPLLSGIVVLHLVFLLLWVFAVARFPIATLPEMLSMVAFAIAGVYLYVEKVQGSKATGAFIVALVTLMQLGSSTFLHHAGAARSEYLRSPLFSLHTVSAVLGYSAFAVGAVYSVMFLLLYRALKRRSFGIMFERLPSLDTLASMAFGSTLLGWMFLTATMGIGTAMGLSTVPHFYRDPQFIATLGVWGLYSVAIGAYFFLGWRGARMVYLSLIGFGLAVAAVVGSHFVFASFHAFSA